MMNKDFLIETTNELYRITLLFPKKEPLRYKLRDLGTDIFAHLIFLLGLENPGNNTLVFKNLNDNLFEETKKQLNVLDGYFLVAKAQNWVSPKDLSEIQSKYYNVREYLRELRIQKNRIKETAPALKTPILKRRHSKILTILNSKGRTQVGELKKDFPGITKRTLRRDFEYLSKKGFVERRGDGKDTFYVIKKTNLPDRTEVRNEMS